MPVQCHTSITPRHHNLQCINAALRCILVVPYMAGLPVALARYDGEIVKLTLLVRQSIKAPALCLPVKVRQAQEHLSSKVASVLFRVVGMA